jgi:hypothetical protein
VHFEDSSVEPIDFDLVICADGSRSIFRSLVHSRADDRDNGGNDDLHFAGGVAWRGIIHESRLPPSVMESLKMEFPHCSNCLNFTQGMDASEAANENGCARQSAVLHDIGDGLVS